MLAKPGPSADPAALEDAALVTGMHLADFSNRHFSRGRSRFVEALWLLVQRAFVSSWVPGTSYRRWLLRAFGAKIGKGVVVKPGVKVKFPWRLSVGDHTWIGEEVWIDNLADVTIGRNCCISQRAYLCTGSHDWSRPSFDLVTSPIHIKEGAWIAACATVGPGVTVGEGAVLSLTAVATHDLEPRTIYFGTRASPIRERVIKTASGPREWSRPDGWARVEPMRTSPGPQSDRAPTDCAPGVSPSVTHSNDIVSLRRL
jgi:putative colanic acid biosynthesis acetyltransferase WcaF